MALAVLGLAAVPANAAMTNLTCTVEATVKENIASFATEAGGTYMLYCKGKRPQKAWDDYWNQTVVPRFSYVGLP